MQKQTLAHGNIHFIPYGYMGDILVKLNTTDDIILN